MVPITTREVRTLATSEQDLLDSIRLDEAWALIEKFATLVRVSGSQDEAESVRYIQAALDRCGVPYRTFEPELYLSIPGPTAVKMRIPGRGTPIEIYAKTPSFSVSTATAGLFPDGQVEGPCEFVESAKATGIGDLFAAAPATGLPDLNGKVALSEGLPMPAKVGALAARGAVAAVFISPGERIHEGICTPVWGAPDLTNQDRQPAIPVAEVSKSDGALIRKEVAAATAGAPVTLSVRTSLEQGWYKCPLVVAEIRGRVWPDEFVLLHGHLDSWHVGVGDNAVGNATLLEVARVLMEHRESLSRSVRLAWWPGHSTGRYAGSTWYADQFALDIHRNCVVHLNCDSPGCRWATVFNDLTTMAETEALARGAILDAAGLPTQTARPERAGDLSFSNIGVPTLFMLSSTISEEDRKNKGLYAVGGCGGNNEWHTEADTLEIADRDNLLRDMRVYALAVWRAANDPVHPLDYRATAAELQELVGRFAEQLGGLSDLTPSKEAVDRLLGELTAFYTTQVVPAEAVGAPLETVRQVNAKLRRVARLLVNVMYSQAGRWRQDPALPVPPLPEFAAAVAALQSGEVNPGFVRTDVVRAQNRLVAAIDEAVEALRG